MFAGIVYDGVPGNRGTLFQGIKFWVAQRVPQRATLVQNIKSNGGEVTIQEKTANYLIADHIKWNSSPHGSFSWQWITESIRRGQLLDSEEFLISRPESESRPKGAVSQKMTRTAFTAEDDRILTKFVLDHQAKDPKVSLSGNSIYKDLEKKYPHHTMHSWRDRWVKKLSHIHNASGQPSSSAPSQPAPGSPSVASPGTQTPTPASAQATPRPLENGTPRASRTMSAASTPKTEKASRKKFTKGEDELLIQHVEDAKASGKKYKGNKIFQELAQDFPQHTPQSWRDRYLKVLQPAMERARATCEVESPSLSQADLRKEQGRKAAQARLAALPPVPDVPSPERDDSPEAEDTTVDGAGSDTISKKSNGVEKGAHSLNQPRSGEKVADSDGLFVEQEKHSPDQPQAPNASSSAERGLDGQSLMLTDVASQSYKAFEPYMTNKVKFYKDLQGYLEFEAGDTGIVHEFPKWPTIQGQTFEMFNLWVAVIGQKVCAAERDWQQISEVLGFDWIEHFTVPDELRECYETHLFKFEEAVRDLPEDDEDDRDGHDSKDEDGDDLDEDAEGDIDEDMTGLTMLKTFNSSPPKQPSRKRDLESALASDHGYPESPRKRPRVSRDEVIPSTPDTKNGTAHLRNPVSAGVSPSDKKYSNLPKSSRAANNIHKDQRGDKMEVDDQVSAPPTGPDADKPPVEPETQDFGFEPQTQNIISGSQMEDAQSEFQDGVSPSQQLRLESEARSPVHILASDSRTTPTRRSVPRHPFPVDDQDNKAKQPIPKPRFGKGTNPLLSSPHTVATPKQKRVDMNRNRSLPASFKDRLAKARASQRRATPGSSRQTAEIAATSSPQVGTGLSSPQSGDTKIQNIIDYYVSLGYPEQVARRSLEATSWIRGLASHLMEAVKNGEALPTNWEGVWTARDNDGLKLVDSLGEAADAKSAKKREKEYNRLEKKHTEQNIEMRRRWLASKDKAMPQ